MFNFFKRKKGKKPVENDDRINETLENVEINTLDMAETGMDLNTDIPDENENYDPYEEK